ncbi:DUF5365 family protein [Lederbergia citrea]|uniref:DUF5365 family protein n=1 Tax=Lederbergia citrea TaxID=2833581 RepID=A0A942Z348_9BACI|nr:DUF5365 family protein [Lederbergia citrea]MBS4177554.1 DUF5365 family protein [Lederbergia citrea]MBS4204228.1 DUF5365 family protein [Lederbergia citrea]MBS4221187.1 DUF5365 family protein [Lederbergia citrea]
MKVVYASTEQQEEKLNHLICSFYSSVFPRYFNDQEIAGFLEMKILHVPANKEEQLYTLEVAFQAIASLQVIISILERPHPHENSHYYASLVNKNINILERSGLFFPFTYDSFFSRKRTKIDDVCSIYTKPTNEILI